MGPRAHPNPRILYFLETRIIVLHFAANGVELSSLKLIFMVGAVNDFISARVAFRPFKVIQGH